MLRSTAALTFAATLALPLTAPASAQPGHDQQRQDFHPGNRGGDNGRGDNRGGFNRGGYNRGDFHPDYNRGGDGDGVAGLLLGLGLGAVVGGAIAPAFQAPPPVYYGAPSGQYNAPSPYYPPPPAYYPPQQQYGY